MTKTTRAKRNRRSTKEQKRFNNAKTPRGCAQAFARWLKGYADEMGYDSNNVHIWKTADDGYGFASPGVWEVVWEEGPYEWTIRLSLGDSMFGNNGHGPEFDLLSNQHGVHPECYNHIALNFFN